ncbi:MAG: PQQ-dependent sugar dehydrogenase [Planctomycetales bacterium]|nr:PQQ-dependent sugar dehydrogenase [Planctomycetales bacterium]
MGRYFRIISILLVALTAECVGQVSVPSAAQTVANASLNELQRQALSATGDPRRGRKLFFEDQRTKCSICHRVATQGGGVGPDLSAIGGKFDRPHLIESVLEPSRQIVEGFHTSRFLTIDNQIVAGIVKNRTEQNLKIVDSEGREQILSTAAVLQEKVDAVSLMPSNISELLKPSEIFDLITYLETLRTGPSKFGAGTTGPITLPPGFAVRVIATGLDGAVAMEILPDSRLLICEQKGSLRVVENDQLLLEPMATFPALMDWERGLIGVTVHPQFPEVSFVYVCYVEGAPYPHHVISRIRVQGNQMLPGTEEILLEGDDQTKLGGNVPAGHQGGALHFGNDGCLYIAIGEQTAGEPAQRLDTLQGKMLRLRADGSIPNDNPFFNKAIGKYRAIWALGCRNPFTFAISSRTGSMLINDVGGKFEEINPGIAGANYGWPTVDHGPRQGNGFVGPVHVYPQASIGGGAFVPETLDWPKEWLGKYLFADFVHGWIHAIDPLTADAENNNAAATFAQGIRRPVDLRISSDGSLYILVRNAWVVDDKYEAGTGSLLKVTYSP